MSTGNRCTHLNQVRNPPPQAGSDPVCEDCIKAGGQWVHLRICLTCGHVGCCDSSPSRHARRHAAEHKHPVIASAEPGEEWRWCYVDDAYV
jgi:hypothetical protein